MRELGVGLPGRVRQDCGEGCRVRDQSTAYFVREVLTTGSVVFGLIQFLTSSQGISWLFFAWLSGAAWTSIPPLVTS